MRIVLLAFTFLLFACSTAPHSDRQPSAVNDSDNEVNMATFNHPEASIKLPFDPIYRDLNHDGKITPDEIRPDNIRKTLGKGQTLFALKPISALGLQRGQLALTVDDGPNSVVTPQILDLLRKYNIKATFFIVGSRIPSHADIVRRLISEGHTVGNHTYSHDVPNITANTITGEIVKSYNTLKDILGHDPEGRILFRAPGLGWNAPKGITLNSNSITKNFIGPIHANLGTDAPRADWACWAKSVTADQCANWYYEDIMNAGRGIVLAHDIYYKEGKGNTYLLLENLLDRLDREGGGIKNAHNGAGVWEFVKIADSKALDQFDLALGASAPATFKAVYNVRSDKLASLQVVDNSSKIVVNGNYLTTQDLVGVTDLHEDLRINGMTFRKVRIDRARPGLDSLTGQVVYIGEGAF